MHLFRVTPSEGLLRLGLAFAFLYPAIDAIFEPSSWLGYLPGIVTQAFHLVSIPLNLSDLVLLHSFGMLEVILAFWVTLARNVRIPAIMMAGILFVIVGFNLDPANFSVVFRDVSIALAALALSFYHQKSLSV